MGKRLFDQQVDAGLDCRRYIVAVQRVRRGNHRGNGAVKSRLAVATPTPAELIEQGALRRVGIEAHHIPAESEQIFSVPQADRPEPKNRNLHRKRPLSLILEA